MSLRSIRQKQILWQSVYNCPLGLVIKLRVYHVVLSLAKACDKTPRKDE